MENIIDLTHTIKDCLPVYPGDDETRLYRARQLESDGYNGYRMEIGMHSGTHIDVPMHLLDDDRYISQFPLSYFIGNGCLIDARDENVIMYKNEYMQKIKENDIVLLYTGYDVKFGSHDYFNNHPVLSMEFAEFLVKMGIKMIGIDTPSPDIYPFDIHKTLLKNDIFIMENLTNLNKLIGMYKFEVIAFPLKIDAEASVVRAAARAL